MSEKHVIPPTPLWFQLFKARHSDHLSLREIARKAGVPHQRIHNLVNSRGRLADFLKVIAALGMRIRITTWENKLLVPLEDSTDFEKLCDALSGYKHYCYSGGMHMRIWPSARRLIMMEGQAPEATLSALDRYLEHIHAHAVLVRVLGDEDASRAAA